MERLSVDLIQAGFAFWSWGAEAVSWLSCETDFILLPLCSCVAVIGLNLCWYLETCLETRELGLGLLLLFVSL